MKLTPAIESEISAARAKVAEKIPWWLAPFLLGGVAAITLGRHIYIRPNPNRSERALKRLLWHELTHVRQVQRLGLLRFLWRYLLEFARHFARERNIQRAYRLISFEVEAWAAEERADV
jgi:Domain of unknown function (DUF4157)